MEAAAGFIELSLREMKKQYPKTHSKYGRYRYSIAYNISAVN